MTTLYKASHNWATRPADERFISLPDMLNSQLNAKDLSVEVAVRLRDCSVDALENNQLVLTGPKGNPVEFNNWSFNQLCKATGLPPSYIAKTPAELAKANFRWALDNFKSLSRDNDDADKGKLLITQNVGLDIPTLRAFTSPTYGRIFDAQITKALIDHFGNGVDGNFKVPGEFGKAVKITKDNTTLFSSDQDMFVFLCDEENRIEMPNRRNGEAGSLARGFFIWNSEVGADTFGVSTFLFDYVCCNRIVWGAEEVKTIKRRHSKMAPDRWIDEVAPMLLDYTKSSSKTIEGKIISAQSMKLEDPAKFLKRNIKLVSDKTVKEIMLVHVKEESKPIETLWDAVTGITAFAKSIPNNNDRVVWEKHGGDLLELAA